MIKRNVLVSGGSGFIGSHIVDKLLDIGHNVFVVDKIREGSNPKSTFYHVDLGNIRFDINGLPDIDVFFHQAADNNTLSQDESSMFNVNYYGSIDLFEDILKKGCRKFIFASSTACYGDVDAPYVENLTVPHPLNVYAKSKLAFEEFAVEFGKKHSINVVGLRYCNVYGDREYKKGKRASMICQLAKNMKSGIAPRIFKNGEQKRDYIYVKDVVKLNILAADYNGVDIFNAGYGKATSFNDVVRLLNKYLNTKFDIEYMDNPFQETYQNYTECDMSKSKKLLKFMPKYDIDRGIKDYLPML